MDFFEAWWWLSRHPINLRPSNFDSTPDNVGLYELDIHVAKVNPKTRKVEDDATLNTRIEIWLEFGPYENYTKEFDDLPDYFARTHDIRLDTGGATFEKAIIKLAKRVKKYYGDYSND